MRDTKVDMGNYKYFILLFAIFYSSTVSSAELKSFNLKIQLSKKIKQILKEKHQLVAVRIIYKTIPLDNAQKSVGPDGYMKLGEELKQITPNNWQQIFINPAWQNHELFIEPIVFSYEDSQADKPANLLTCPAHNYRIAQKRIVVKCFL